MEMMTCEERLSEVGLFSQRRRQDSAALQLLIASWLGRAGRGRKQTAGTAVNETKYQIMRAF